MLGGTIEEVPERYREMSPITYAKKETVPTLLIHGTNDKIVPFEQAEVFEQALKKAGASVELVRMEGAGHSDFGKQPHIVAARMVEFLQKQLKEPAH
jgi:dipeptidyl aminopeptidase/acylaminoacyl peptidase